MTQLPLCADTVGEAPRSARLESDSKGLTAELSGAQGQRFAALEEEVRTLREREAGLQARRDELLTRIGQLGGGASVATLRARMLREMRTGGVDPNELYLALEAATSAVQDRHAERVPPPTTRSPRPTLISKRC